MVYCSPCINNSRDNNKTKHAKELSFHNDTNFSTGYFHDTLKVRLIVFQTMVSVRFDSNSLKWEGHQVMNKLSFKNQTL